MAHNYSGSTALVTGASSGLGEQFARQLAARGASLVITARSTGKLEALAGELRDAHGTQIQVVPQDLSATGGALELCDKVDKLGLTIDHLMNNAGFGQSSEFIACDIERETQMIRLNCEAVVTLARHFLPGMVARKHGGVLSVASVAGVPPMPYLATYGATKSFVINWTAALAEELRGTGVKVNALCPGPVPTGFQDAAGVDLAGTEMILVLSAEETVRRGLKAYERGRIVYVPGAMNKMGIWGVKFAPRQLAARAVALTRKSPRQ